jgi:rod shape-determining protein MreD
VRWAVFAIFGLVALVIETSLTKIFTLHSLGGIEPSVTICLLAFIAMFAPRHTALWSCWLLGVFVDLCTDLPQGSQEVVILLGPHALGYTFACFVILQVRAMLFRRSVLTISLMSFVSYLAASLVVVAIYSVRRWYPEDTLYWTDARATGELLRRLGIAAYSFLLALPLGWVLLSLSPVWGFQAATQRAGGWR